MSKMLWLVNKAEVVELFNEFAQSCICGERNPKKKYDLCHGVYLSVSACATYMTNVEPEMSQSWRYGDSFSTAAMESSLS